MCHEADPGAARRLHCQFNGFFYTLHLTLDTVLPPFYTLSHTDNEYSTVMTSRVFTSRGYALAVPNFFRHMGILSPVTNPATGRSCRMKSPSGCTVSWIGPEASKLCHRGCAMHAPVALRSNRPWQRAAISFCSSIFSGSAWGSLSRATAAGIHSWE